MMYHLSSQSVISRQKFSKEAWLKVLGLAKFYGWQPMGTRPPSSLHEFFNLYEFFDLDIEAWNGTYLTNDGQTVTSEDALSLAIALEKSLDDIPDFNLEGDPPDLSKITPFEYFAGDKKHHLTDFIKFCRLGSFIILRI